MLSAHQLLTKKKTKQKKNQHHPPTVYHPPYSPDLTPSDFFLFPRMKKVLKGKHFAQVEAVKQKMADTLKGIKIEEFKNCFEQWKNISLGVLHQMGGCIEGD